LAGIEARDRRFGHVGTESLLMGLLLEADERAGTSEASSDLVERVREVIGQRVGAGRESDLEARVIELTPRARQVLKRAAYEAAEQQAANVSPPHILLAASHVGEGEGLIALDALNVSPDELLERLYG
jgi:ATP-dependent Clp protease ATP-binding subunit ClpA